MKFTMEINMDGAAFEDNPGELPWLISRVARRIEDQGAAVGASGPVLDSNGTTRGSWEVK